MTAEALQQAYEHHRGGRLDEAERMYRQVLAAEPRNVHALHLLGSRRAPTRPACRGGRSDHAGHRRGRQPIYVLRESGRRESGTGPLRRGRRRLARSDSTATRSGQDAQRPGRAVGEPGPNSTRRPSAFARSCASRTHSRSGAQQPGQYPERSKAGTDEAIECFRAAIRAKPDMVQAHNNLGNALKAEGRVDEAVDAISRGFAHRSQLCRGILQPGPCAQGSKTSPTRQSRHTARRCGFGPISSRPDSISATCSRPKVCGARRSRPSRS